MVQDIVKLNIFLFKITILNLSLLYKDIFVRIARKLSPLPLILSVITLIYLIILSILLLLNLKKMYLLHLLLRDIMSLLLSMQRVMNICYPDFKVNKEHLPEAICIDEF